MNVAATKQENWENVSCKTIEHVDEGVVELTRNVQKPA